LLDEPDIVLWNADCVIGTWRSVVVAVWRLQTRVDALIHMESLLRRHGIVHKRVGVLQVLESTVQPLEADQRKALEQTMSSCNAISSSAVVYEGSGFQAAAVRAVVAGVSALRRHPFPHQIFASVGKASEFHARHLTQPPDFQEGLERATQILRQWSMPSSEGRDRFVSRVSDR
jgi:hypothetical protein